MMKIGKRRIGRGIVFQAWVTPGPLRGGENRVIIDIDKRMVVVSGDVAPEAWTTTIDAAMRWLKRLIAA